MCTLFLVQKNFVIKKEVFFLNFKGQFLSKLRASSSQMFTPPPGQGTQTFSTPPPGQWTPLVVL